MTNPKDIVYKLLEVIKNKDIEHIASVLSDDVTFDGPSEQWKDKQEYIENIKNAFSIRWIKCTKTI
ncbi:MAG: nuclear transport factor 2 family protein [Nitrososphaeraceae archaeon]